MTDTLIHRARDVAGRLHETAEHIVRIEPELAGEAAEAAAIIAELIELLEGRGECICGKCGMRHGGSIVRGDF